MVISNRQIQSLDAVRNHLCKTWLCSGVDIDEKQSFIGNKLQILFSYTKPSGQNKYCLILIGKLGKVYKWDNEKFVGTYISVLG